MISHCENLRFRFAILDPAPKSVSPPVGADLNDIQNQRNQFDTKYAAIYYPRVVIENLMTATNIALAPSGHIAGIYARVDEQRRAQGASQRGARRHTRPRDDRQQRRTRDLNPEPVNINVLRDFRHNSRGLRVWGARCITSDPDWKYINVRRLFVFIEKSIEIGTQSGGVRTEQRSAMGAHLSKRRGVPYTGVAHRRAAGNETGRGVLREV